MTPEHLQEIRDTPFIRPESLSEAMFHVGLAQGHRQVLLEYVDELTASIDKFKRAFAAYAKRQYNDAHVLQAAVDELAK